MFVIPQLAEVHQLAFDDRCQFAITGWEKAKPNVVDATSGEHHGPVEAVRSSAMLPFVSSDHIWGESLNPSGDQFLFVFICPSVLGFVTNEVPSA